MTISQSLRASIRRVEKILYKDIQSVIVTLMTSEEAYLGLFRELRPLLPGSRCPFKGRLRQRSSSIALIYFCHCLSHVRIMLRSPDYYDYIFECYEVSLEESVYPGSISLLGTLLGQEVRKRKRKGAGLQVVPFTGD